MSTKIKQLNNKSIELSNEMIDGLKSQLTGQLILPTDQVYDEERKIWNGMIDKKPGLIVKCLGTADVVAAVKFANEHKLLTCVRGAGHNIAGMAVSDDALMIDLSAMKWVLVDPATRKAVAGPGATLRHIDHETQLHGLALPVGINSTTGISGLTLGGGFGWLSRSYGLTIDNLLSAEVVTADGSVVQASEKENEDLFWAIRGGSGNFGIITSFQFQLYPVGPQVLAGLIVHKFSDAKAVFKHYKKVADAAPDKLTCWVVMRKAPPLPFLPEDIHGKEVFIIATIYSGDLKEGEIAMEELRKFGNPVADVVGPVPFEAWQQAFDPLLTPGLRNYWKSHYFTELSEGLMDVLIDQTNKLPTPHTEIFFGQLGGKINTVAPDATAYPHRNISYVMNIHTRWEEKATDDTCVKWAKDVFEKTAPYSSGAVYVNFVSEGEDRVPEAYGGNYKRLAKIKAKYDPENLFRMNQNIKPE